jgi:hypothetical protein
MRTAWRRSPAGGTSCEPQLLMHKQRASRHRPTNCDFSEKEPTDSPEGCKRRIRRDLGTDYTPGAVICEPFCGLLRVRARLGALWTPWRAESVAALIHAWRPALRWVYIAFPAASPLTASKDFVTWSAGEILSSADEKTATILESGAMTNVVRSVNA